MKMNLMKLAFLSTAVCFSGMFMGACDSEEDDLKIVDWSPVGICISVHDAQGNDLLDSTDVERYIASGVTATFQGKTYALNGGIPKENAKKSSLKALPAVFEGLSIKNISGKNMLYFGELNGDADMHENLTITWKDGSKDVITYHCSDHNEELMNCNRWYKLNGVLTNNPIEIVK